jgi:hypothetical protein
MKVKGIGKKIFEQNKNLLSVWCRKTNSLRILWEDNLVSENMVGLWGNVKFLPRAQLYTGISFKFQIWQELIWLISGVNADAGQ